MEPATRTGRVEVTAFGVVELFDPGNWPDGDFLRRIVSKYVASDSNKTPLLPSPEMWQTNARWALLKSWDLIACDDCSDAFSSNDQRAAAVQLAWQRLVLESKRLVTPQNDLHEFLSTARSLGRRLQWSVLECPAGSQFRLHVHPNLELVYCIRGKLHEMRWMGDPKSYKSGGPWKFASLGAGEWLVNQSGSIHKSFTSSNEDCVLLALWGGSHQDLAELTAVTDVVIAADEKLCQGDCTNTMLIQPIFLPDSER